MKRFFMRFASSADALLVVSSKVRSWWRLTLSVNRICTTVMMASPNAGSDSKVCVCAKGG